MVSHILDVEKDTDDAYEQQDGLKCKHACVCSCMNAAVVPFSRTDDLFEYSMIAGLEV
jgi:hypothetical protein